MQLVWISVEGEGIKQTLSSSGARGQLGLYPMFLAARLPGPSMRMDALIGRGPASPAYDLVTEVIQSLLPVMEKLKLATAAEVGLATLAQRMREEVVAAPGSISPRRSF